MFPTGLAPEQHLGEGARQADVYSLAVTLYQMLSRELPFPGPDYLDPDPKDRHATVRDFLAAFEDNIYSDIRLLY